MQASNPTTHPPNRHPADRRRRVADAGPLGPSEGSPLFGGAVSFRVRRLEPSLAWLMAGYTLWVNIVLNPSGAAVWWMALMAASVGGWSRMFPAHHQGAMFGRGVLLIVGAFFLHMAPGSEGATGPYFLWPVLVTLFYSLLLSAGWSSLLVGLALVEFGFACWLAQPSVSWQQALAYVGFLAAAPPLSMAFGRSMRASDEQAESSLRDERTMLYNESGFFVHGAVLLAECRKGGRPFSMVLLNGGDLRDIPELLGRKVANELFAQAVQAIGAIPGEGIAARIDSLEFALLLPGVTAERAAALVKQRLGEPPQLVVKIAGKPVIIVLDMAIAQTKDQEQTIEELYDSLHVRWAQEKKAAIQAPKKGPVMDSDEGRFIDASSTVPMQLPAHLRNKSK